MPTFRSFDDTELAYRSWLPARPARRALLLFHRGHEHSGRWAQTVAALDLPETAIFAWDQRGHGASPGPRGGAPSVAALVRDADHFARHVSSEHGIPIEEMAILAHSVGAVVATGWVHDYAPPIRGMVLAAPAFRVKLYVPLAVPALRLRQRVLGPGEVRSYVKSRVLTHDPVEAAAYDADPAIFRQIAVNVLLDLHDTSRRLVDDAGAITVPTLVMAAGSDWVVRLDAQRRFVERLGSTVRRMEFFPGMYHAMFHERDRVEVVACAGRFLTQCFLPHGSAPQGFLPRDVGGPSPRHSLVDADRGGFTRSEYDRLRLPPGPLAGLRWKAARGFLRTVGRLSAGIDLGWHSGFDSGQSLDYVYRNSATGRGPLGLRQLGRMIDRIYLDSPGWRGIRVRREHLQELLREAIAATRREGRPVHVVDIAAGGGRYLLETLAALGTEGPPQATALLRDLSPANVVAARTLADALGLQGIEVRAGDAFDRTSLAGLEPRPTIAIASGIYELFPDNDGVLASLRGLAEAMSGGGRLLYTCQPWHPQLEFIARVLANRDGRPWVMRRRTQQEMDDLVTAAGFVKETQRIDRWGIFSVGMASIGIGGLRR